MKPGVRRRMGAACVVLALAGAGRADAAARIPYLVHAAGVRHAAMGGSFAALVGPSPSLFGNSAALAHAGRRDITFITAEPAFENRLLAVHGAWPLTFGGNDRERRVARRDVDKHPPAHAKRRKDEYFFTNADRTSLFDTGRTSRRDGTHGETIRGEPERSDRTKPDAPGEPRPRREFFTPLQRYRATVAAAWARSVIGDIQVRDDWGYPAGTTEDARNTVALAVGAPATEDLSFGIAACWHTCDIAGDGAFGFGMDFGVMYRPLFWQNTAIGVTFRNVFGSLGWSVYDPIMREKREYQEPLGWEMRVGAGQRLLSTVQVAGDLVLERDVPVRFAVGAEVELAGVAAIRAGLAGINPTAGFGLRLPHMSLDYALVSNPASGMQHHLGVSAGF